LNPRQHGSLWLDALRRDCFFVLQQPAFPMQAPCVALEIAIAGDDSMARHDDGDRIGTIGCTNVDGRARIVEAEFLGELAVGRVRACRNMAQRGSDPAL